MKKIIILLYRFIYQLFDPIRFLKGMINYFRYFRDIILYRVNHYDKNFPFTFLELYPQIHDKGNHSYSSHYFYQQLRCFSKIVKHKPNRHVDVGSSTIMSGYISSITKVEFVDIRPLDIKIENLSFVKGNILKLPYQDNKIYSLSCLHVLEHIGLGRYGDTMDINGSKKGAKELSRILAKGGYLYLSIPIGRQRIAFNAHRIFNPLTVLSYFSQLELIHFSYIDDTGKRIKNIDINDNKLNNLNRGCGFFQFTKN